MKRVYLASGSTERMLQISNLNAWYGASHVLQDISIEVSKGEIVCLIGRNGAGKTTTLKVDHGPDGADAGHRSCSTAGNS